MCCYFMSRIIADVQQKQSPFAATVFNKSIVPQIFYEHLLKNNICIYIIIYNFWSKYCSFHSTPINFFTYKYMPRNTKNYSELL